MRCFLNLLKQPYFTIKRMLVQARISIGLLRFSIDKDKFFFENRGGLVEIIKNTMKIDDFLILVFAMVGLGLALYEVSTGNSLNNDSLE